MESSSSPFNLWKYGPYWCPEGKANQEKQKSPEEGEMTLLHMERR